MTWIATSRRLRLGAVASGLVALTLFTHGYRVDGRERAAKIFDPGHPLTRGMTVRVAWTPADPVRIYIIGEHPWTWWVAMRPLFAVIAGVSLMVAFIGFALEFALARS